MKLSRTLPFIGLGAAAVLSACGGNAAPEQAPKLPTASDTIQAPLLRGARSPIAASAQSDRSSLTMPINSAPFLRALDQPVAAQPYGDLLVVDTQVNNSATAHLGIDTGAPTTVIRPQLVGASGPTQVNVDLAVGAHEFSQVPVVAQDILAGSGLDGLLGCTVICQQEISFNYRDREFTLGDPEIPRNVAAPDELPFQLKGGISFLGIPKSRIIVTAEIEGKSYNLLVDSGAFAIALRGTVYQQIIADGRATFDLPVSTVAGESPSHMLRLHDLSIGGVSVDNPVATSGDALDKLFRNVSLEVWQKIDGVVGATFLHDFFVSVDYANQKLILRRYSTQNHIHDLAIRVGFFVGAGQNGAIASVASVVPNSDADHKGVQAGDAITAVGGIALTADNAGQLLGALEGAAGRTVDVEFGAAGTKNIAIQDLLPFTALQ